AGRPDVGAVNFAETVAGAAKRSVAELSNWPMMPSVKWLRALDGLREVCACETTGATKTATAEIATRMEASRCMVSGWVGPAAQFAGRRGEYRILPSEWAKAYPN